MSTDPPAEDVRHQWRVCGRRPHWTADSSSANSSWTGTWHDGTPSGEDVLAVLERNAFSSALWIELRSVTTKITTQTLKSETAATALPAAVSAAELPPAITAQAVSEGIQIEARAPRVVISQREASALLERLRTALAAFGLPAVAAEPDAVLLADALADGVAAMRDFSTELVRIARQLSIYATSMESEARAYGG